MPRSLPGELATDRLLRTLAAGAVAVALPGTAVVTSLATPNDMQTLIDAGPIGPW
ncbi:hypothetical protein HQ560_21075 [bacterium]|nr:hypothetical protein [bacterium]